MRGGSLLLCVFVFLVALCNAQKPTVPAEPIMSCNFDDGLCEGWEHEKELYKWIIRRGPAKEAGPKYDYTRGNDEGGYLFFNDRRERFGKAIIRTPRMDLSKEEKYCLRFVYFSAGTAPGEIRIYHSNKKEGRTVSIFFKAGARSLNDTHWIFEDVTISQFFSDQPFDDVYFRIQATRGRTNTNVVAIDDITVTPGSCPKFQFPKTATTATFGPRTVAPQGAVQEDLTNEEVKKRNEETIRKNEERNKKVQEMNALINSGQYSTTIDPNQPTQPTQPTQPQQTTTTGMSEAEKQEKIREEQRQLQKEAEERRNAERERLEREEKERKELIEKRRRDQEEKERKLREEEERKNKEIADKQKQERLEKQKRQEEREKLRAQKKREEDEKKAKEKADRDRKMREEQERKQREEAERKRKEEEERKRKIEEERSKNQQQQGDQNKRQRGKGKRGTGKRGQGGKGRGGGRKGQRAGNPNYEKCGEKYAHKTKQICCDGSPRKRFNPETMCCGEVSYDSNTTGCCGTQTYDARGTTQCCGTDLYDAVVQACCGEVAYELATNACIDGVVEPIIT